MKSISAINKKGRGRPAVNATPVQVRMPPEQLARLDAYVAKHPQPCLTRPEAVRQLVEIGLAADAAINDRLASAKKPAAAPEVRQAKAARAKELAVGAVKQALAEVDAPDEEKMERKRKLVAPPAMGKIGKQK